MAKQNRKSLPYYEEDYMGLFKIRNSLAKQREREREQGTENEATLIHHQI